MTNKASTRKKKIVATTIPELKRSFDALEGEVQSIIRSTAAPAARVKKFQAAWRRIFGRPVEASAAAAYLQVKSRKAHKKTRKAQRGGAALSGAPLDHQTGPGIYGPHGVFPPYVAGGLSFYNTVNQAGQFKGCGIEDSTPKVPVDIGSGGLLKGGGKGPKKANSPALTGGGMLSDALQSITGRPIPASAPPSVFSDFQQMWMGRPMGPSPAPEDNHLKYMG
jgi:hypothetical protein